MRIFTVATKHHEWESLSRECVLRLKSYAGVESVEIIWAKDQFDSHIQKLLHPLASHEHVWFFDADWWMMKPSELPEIPNGGIVATYCRTGHERYCNSLVDIERIFGTTLWGADMSSLSVRAAFIKALHLQSEFYWNGKPKADESFLNIACQNLAVPVTFIGSEWNHCGPPIGSTIGLHAGGRWPKLDWMKAHCLLP